MSTVINHSRTHCYLWFKGSVPESILAQIFSTLVILSYGSMGLGSTSQIWCSSYHMGPKLPILFLHYQKSMHWEKSFLLLSFAICKQKCGTALFPIMFPWFITMPKILNHSGTRTILGNSSSDGHPETPLLYAMHCLWNSTLLLICIPYSCYTGKYLPLSAYLYFLLMCSTSWTPCRDGTINFSHLG